MFCINPFKRAIITESGNVHICCTGWLPDKNIGNILRSNLMDLWKGPDAKEIRESILDQSFRYCTTCPYLPGPRAFTKLSSPPAPYWDPTRIETLELTYDQSCNLTCPSCRLTPFNLWKDKKERITKAHEIHKAFLNSGALAHIDTLYITESGDPFASEVYWPFLKNFPDMRNNNKLCLYLQTNGQLFDREHWEQMGSAKERVRTIGISVDAACEKTYKLNRGASWNKLWNNVSFINSIRKNPPNNIPISLGMFFVMQENNFLEIPEFVKLAMHNQIAWIVFQCLRNYGTYSSEKYLHRAIHLPSHPRHEQFLNTLQDPILKNEAGYCTVMQR